jgi:hypothetical protein
LRGGAQVPIGALANDSPRLQIVATIEAPPDGRTPPVTKALHHLYLGDVAAAVADGSLTHPQLLLVAAASDGAPDELVARALAAPPDQVPAVFALYGRALARRAGRDPEPYRVRLAAELDKDQAAHLETFFAALGRDPAAAEAALAGLPFELRAFTFAAGTVALGANSPDRWRELAKLGLLPTERPFLR